MDLSVSGRDDGEQTIVSVEGNLTSETASQLQQDLVRLIVANCFHLVLDLSDVEQVDATAVAPVLLDAAERLRLYQGEVRVVDPAGLLDSALTKRTEGGQTETAADTGKPLLSTYRSLAQALRV